MYSGFLNDGVLLLNVSSHNFRQGWLMRCQEQVEEYVCQQSVFIQFLSYTVSPILITNNTTLYLHIQVPLSLLLALWFLWKDLQYFL